MTKSDYLLLCIALLLQGFVCIALFLAEGRAIKNLDPVRIYLQDTKRTAAEMPAKERYFTPPQQVQLLESFASATSSMLVAIDGFRLGYTRVRWIVAACIALELVLLVKWMFRRRKRE